MPDNQFDPWLKRGRCEPGEWPSVDGQAQDDYRAEGHAKNFCYPGDNGGTDPDNNMCERRYGPDNPHNHYGYGNSGVQFSGYSAPWT